MITNKINNNDLKTHCIVFRSAQLRCDLSGLSVNIGESLITQYFKVIYLGVTFDQFFNFDDTAICRSTYIHIRKIGKIWNLLSYNSCSTIIHALISCRLYYCISRLYNVPTHKTDRLQYFRINARASYQNHRVENTLPRLKKTYINSKLRIESHLQYVCLYINRITILHRLIYVN